MRELNDNPNNIRKLLKSQHSRPPPASLGFAAGFAGQFAGLVGGCNERQTDAGREHTHTPTLANKPKEKKGTNLIDQEKGFGQANFSDQVAKVLPFCRCALGVNEISSELQNVTRLVTCELGIYICTQV